MPQRRRSRGFFAGLLGGTSSFGHSKRRAPKGQSNIGQARKPKNRATGERRLEATYSGLQVRLFFVMAFMAVAYGAVGYHLTHLGMNPTREPKSFSLERPTNLPKRGNIYASQTTRNEPVLLATSLQTYALYADPKFLENPKDTLQRLQVVIPDLRTSRLLPLVKNSKRRFVWLHRRLTPEQAQAVHDFGLPGLGLRLTESRFYPHKDLFGHALGYVDTDSQGITGLEKSFQNNLLAGEDVQTTLDVHVQAQLYQSLQWGLTNAKARGAWGLVLDAKTRDILALASIPAFNPNHPTQYTFNPVTQGTYETGSIFKLFTLAQALDRKLVNTETLIDARNPIRIGKFTIRDFHAKNRKLSVREVLRYSSNIGAAKMADMIGANAQKTLLNKLGLTRRHALPLPVASPQVPKNWRRIQSLTISYGHGLATTPLQVANAVASIAMGEFCPPRLVKQVGESTRKNKLCQRVLKPETTDKMRDLMADVVTEGSGRRGQVAGIAFGGKTGTAEKVQASGYSETNNLTSFVAAVPIDNPKIVVLMMFDEPSKDFATGGRSAAPAVGEFLRRTRVFLDLEPAE